jgi:hypothetical protein
MNRVVIPAVLFAMVASTGCRTQGLQFREDRRIEILAPTDRSEVRLPIVIRWRSNSPGRFGVFVDIIPQPPGVGLEHFFRKDPSCRPASACVIPDQLARIGVFETTDTSFTIPSIARRVGVPKDQEDWHEVTISQLDERGRRMGEFGDWVLLKLKR